MSLFSGPEEHAANPPSTWKVVKARTTRLWHVQTANGATIESATTKREAEERTRTGSYVKLYDDTTRWYAGESVRGWKPWTQVKAERERNERWQAERRAAKGA